MSYTSLNAEQLRGMLLAGATTLGMHIEEINSLNVFPVPDGDTGTNMNLTIESASRELKKPETNTVNKVAEAISLGSLMGARGNSGVILSQLFRGLGKRLATEDTVTPLILAEAMQQGVTTAYKAVIKPVEGTILTVAKNSARAALRSARTAADLNTVLNSALKEAYATLERTPDMLPVLKQAGVVDAGGKGLCYIYEGWQAYLEGRATDSYQPATEMPVQSPVEQDDLAYLYCTEFIVTGQKLDELLFRKELSNWGDSLLVVGASGLIKVHIHTNNPGDVLAFALEKGEELQDIKIENMRLQHTEMIAPPMKQPPSPPAKQKSERIINGVIAVASGAGLEEIFRSMGVDVVIAGGQTMNPSTEDFISAIGDVAAEQVIILPNNGNIILAATQAGELVDKPVAVISTKTIPQGLTALLHYDPEEADLAAVAAAMEQGSKRVKSGQVTYAVRDSKFDGKPITEGNILGIVDGKIKIVGTDVRKAVMALVENMLEADSEIVTLFYGEDVEREEAQNVAQTLEELYPQREIELHPGNQPLYYYIIAVE